MDAAGLPVLSGFCCMPKFSLVIDFSLKMNNQWALLKNHPLMGKQKCFFKKIKYFFAVLSYLYQEVKKTRNV